jgi:APA family basic amino acid/polyamine antiporter
MARDGMLPEMFHRVNPRTLTPVRNTVLVAVFVGLLGALVPLDVLTNLTSMGTLVAFAVVSIGVIVLRRRQPNVEGFRVPGYPVVPIVSVLACAYLVFGLPWDTFALFAVWLAIAFVLYLAYGVKHSVLARGRGDKSDLVK